MLKCTHKVGLESPAPSDCCWPCSRESCLAAAVGRPEAIDVLVYTLLRPTAGSAAPSLSRARRTLFLQRLMGCQNLLIPPLPPLLCALACGAGRTCNQSSWARDPNFCPVVSDGQTTAPPILFWVSILWIDLPA